MPESVKTLRLWQMVYLGKGASVNRLIIHAIISIALRLFFRRIEAVNVERMPQTGALLFVLNHPNGLVDPALVYVSLPRRISFLAKSTLYDNPIGAFVLRTFEILPVYRRIDADARFESNAVTFDNCFELLRRGRCIAIFPEGISHDQPHLQKIKTGSARIALGAVSEPSASANATATNILRLMITDGQLPFPLKDFRKRWHPALIRAGINKNGGTREENFHFHDLRKELASELIRRNVNPNVVQKLFAHSDMSITNIYMHTEIDELKAAVNSLDASILQPSMGNGDVIH